MARMDRPASSDSRRRGGATIRCHTTTRDGTLDGPSARISPITMHRDSLAYQDLDRPVGVVLPGALGFAVGFVASIAATMISWACGAGNDPRVGLVLLTVTAIAVGAATTVPGAIAAGALCWAFYCGFILDRAGTLTLDRSGGQTLLTIVLSAAAASVVASLMRWARAVAADCALARQLPASANTRHRPLQIAPRPGWQHEPQQRVDDSDPRADQQPGKPSRGLVHHQKQHADHGQKQHEQPRLQQSVRRP
jgi:hypothetical protein